MVSPAVPEVLKRLCEGKRARRVSPGPIAVLTDSRYDVGAGTGCQLTLRNNHFTSIFRGAGKADRLLKKLRLHASSKSTPPHPHRIHPLPRANTAGGKVPVKSVEVSPVRFAQNQAVEHSLRQVSEASRRSSKCVPDGLNPCSLA